MKWRNVIAISFTKHRDYISKNLVNIINSYNINELKKQFESSLSHDAQKLISSNDFKRPNVYNVVVSFKDMERSGNAGYSTIYLNIKLLNNIIENIPHNTQYHLNRLVCVFIHELVHIKQHSRQDNPWETTTKVRPLEYRSYIVDRKKFIQTIKCLNKGIKTPDYNIIHASSPQEITARAHSFVLNHLNKIITHNPLTLQPVVPNMILLNSWIDMLEAKLIDPKYQVFNKPDKKEYKIYKRYMKLVYQELMEYREFLIGIRNNLMLK